MSDGIREVNDQQRDLHAQRLRRLEQITVRLQQLYGEVAMVHNAKAEQKAQLYQGYAPGTSHGERQARAAAETVNMDSDETSLRAEIDQLKEERDFIKFLVEVW